MSTIKITAAAVVALAVEKGCDVQEQKSFFKITHGENRKAIYVAKSKRVLTRVDFSGWDVEECDLIKSISEEDAKELRLGKVRGQLLTKNLPLETTDEMILEALDYPFFELLGEEEGFKQGPKKEEVSEEEVIEADLEEEHMNEIAADALDLQR